jgi:serine protease Do
MNSLKFMLLIMSGLTSTLFAQVDGNRARRETDVVRAVRAEKDAVVNVSTTVLMKQEEENDNVFQFFNLFPGENVPSHSLGSGFIIHQDGYIVTNAHVVQRAREVTVSFSDKTTAKAQAVYADFEHDLAVIKINPPKKLHVLPLGRGGDDLMIGETVIAIGNPLGYQHTITVGVISATKRTLDFPNGQVYRDLIQTDAAINPGNSGGPLLNINGELIGINSAIRGDAQNLGFAIDVQALKRILPDLLNPENIRRIHLGFKYASDSNDRVRIVTVNENSPAYHAGLQAGDLVTACDGKKFQTPIDFYVAMLQQPAGQKMTLTLQRDQKSFDVAIPFDVKPKPNGLALARKHLGLVLSRLSAEQAQQMGLAENPLLVVEKVLAGSPSATAGIRKGDIFYQLDRYRLDSLEQVAQILESAKRGQKIQVVIVRPRGGFYNVGRFTLKLN